MADFKLTPNQDLAVNHRGSSILVSAAAGSGKTRVLTQRLMGYISSSSDISIENFLVISYTKAAAAELRGRIMEELSALSLKNPKSRHLRREVNKCYSAPITTIDGFCANLIREYAHIISLSPDFIVGDEDKCQELKEKALEKVIDEAYEAMEENSDFAFLIDALGTAHDDRRLIDILFKLREKTQSHPYPEKWIEQQLEALKIEQYENLEDSPWGKEILSSIKTSVDFYKIIIANLIKEIQATEGADALNAAYTPSLLETVNGLIAFSDALSSSFDKAAAASNVPFPKLKALRNCNTPRLQDLVKLVRKFCQDTCKKHAKALSQSADSAFQELSENSRAMSALLRLCLAFDEEYTLLKTRHNLLDFGDLEHLAIKLLWDYEKNEKTPLAINISKRYEEIMIDEYQDVNAVQSLIFNALSKDHQNLFMVGDVKQSIYRFRLADPSIFINEYQRSKDINSAQEGDTVKILLQENFRSDRAILDCCNHVFSNLMSESLGDVEYNAEAALNAPESLGKGRGLGCLHIVEVPTDEDEAFIEQKSLYYEAKHVADLIYDLIDKKETINDKGVIRPLAFSDIAILLQAPKSSGQAFAMALSEKNIPVSSLQGESLFESDEIIILRALLSIIDNPRRDVALASILCSPIFSFSPDELSKIRGENLHDNLYSALCTYEEKDEKLNFFLESLNEFRALSFDLSVYELVSHIYKKLDLLSVFPFSSQEKFLLFLDLAQDFENSGFCGIYDFLARLEQMEKRGTAPLLSSKEGGNSVTIMSIHKSKGLEFPVVILANANRKFNQGDLRGSVLVHPSLGLGGKIVNQDLGVEYKGIAFRAIEEKLKRELLSEQMRVLYVALTRSRERLYVTAAAKNPEKLTSSILTTTGKASPELLMGYDSFLKWLLCCCIVVNPHFHYKIISPNEKSKKALEVPKEEEKEQQVESFDINLETLAKNLSFVYPHSQAVSLPSKLTSSSLPQEQDMEISELFQEPEKVNLRLPNFLEDTSLSPTQKGIANHLLMQYINFEKTSTEKQIGEEVERLEDLGLLTKAQGSAINKKSIQKFFSSPIGKRILNCQKVYREFSFSLLVKACDYFETEETDEILLQGVIDCCIEEEGKLTIIDYKTDFVTNATIDSRIDHYKSQLRAYSRAMSEICKQPVEKTVLYFLRTGLIVEI